MELSDRKVLMVLHLSIFPCKKKAKQSLNWKIYGTLCHPTATCWWLWEMAPYKDSQTQGQNYKGGKDTAETRSCGCIPIL